MSSETNIADQAMPSGKVTISENALLADIDEEAVILNVNNEHYYGLDRTGVNFWTWLKEEGDIDKVLAKAVEAYDIPSETLRKDLGVFVIELSNAGLLTFAEEPN